jgi:hypothetical protein
MDVMGWFGRQFKGFWWCSGDKVTSQSQKKWNKTTARIGVGIFSVFHIQMFPHCLFIESILSHNSTPYRMKMKNYMAFLCLVKIQSCCFESLKSKLFN